MRAGTLSDPRTIALLRRHFVCAYGTLLQTKDLVRDRSDLPFLQRHGLHAGDVEAFFSPAGELLARTQTIRGGPGTENPLYTRTARARPDASVAKLFRAAARALEATNGQLPADFDALSSMDHPLVVREKERPIPPPRSDGPALLVSVRNDALMYKDVVGSTVLPLDRAAARRLLPESLHRNAESLWPDATFVRVLREAYPRGKVLIDLHPHSVNGYIRSRVRATDGTTTQGHFSGELFIYPRTDLEAGARPNARCRFVLRTRLVGDFTWDEHQDQFRSFRLTSDDATLEYHHPMLTESPDFFGRQTYHLGIELRSRPK